MHSGIRGVLGGICADKAVLRINFCAAFAKQGRRDRVTQEVNEESSAIACYCVSSDLLVLAEEINSEFATTEV